jgi:hypothetical protein
MIRQDVCFRLKRIPLPGNPNAQYAVPTNPANWVPCANAGNTGNIQPVQGFATQANTGGGGGCGCGR